MWSPSSAASCGQTPITSTLAGPAPIWKEYSYDSRTGNRAKVVSRSTRGSIATSSYTYPAAGSARPHGATAVSFMHHFPAIRVLANVPVSLTGIIMAHANGGDGCAIAATGTIVCGGSFNPGGPDTGGTMIGDTFVTEQATSKVFQDADLLDHESRHSEQWAGFGAVNFIVSYVTNNAISGVVVGNRACANYFEADAGFKEGNYGYC